MLCVRLTFDMLGSLVTLLVYCKGCWNWLGPMVAYLSDVVHILFQSSLALPSSELSVCCIQYCIFSHASLLQNVRCSPNCP